MSLVLTSQARINNMLVEKKKKKKNKHAELRRNKGKKKGKEDTLKRTNIKDNLFYGII